MASSMVEVIDLTNSSPCSPKLSRSPPIVSPLVETKPNRRERRRLASLATHELESTSGDPSATTTIVISDDDAPDEPPNSLDTITKYRRRRKRKQKDLEEGEVAGDELEPTNGRHEGSSSSNWRKFEPDSQSNRGGVGGLSRHSVVEEDYFPRERRRSREREHRLRSATPPLFYIDDKPDEIPADLPVGAGAEDLSSSGLLLPGHVKVDSRTDNKVPMVIEASVILESDDDEFIHYMDIDETQKAGSRYYDEHTEPSDRLTHYVCGHCGIEGEHRTVDCPVLICLTCGARNEHSTRGCPISKTCFTCGMKGHINKVCPNRNASRRAIERDCYYDCERCGSDLHSAKECPTLWRIYEYVEDDERERNMRSRRAKERLVIGQGGEGYIGEHLWCYNCGDDGHLGDDCDSAPRPPDFPKEPSAFSLYNTLSGPFADHSSTTDRRKRPREWEVDGCFDDGYGFAGPSDVGKRGRDNERERMRRKVKEMEQVDDDDDWFGNHGRSTAQALPLPLRPKTKSGGGGKNSGNAEKQKPAFEFSLKGQSSKFDLVRRPADRLLERISLTNPHEVGRAEERRRNRGRDNDLARDHDGDRGHRNGPSSKSSRDRDHRSSEGSSRRNRDQDTTRDSGKTRRDDRRYDEKGGRRQYYGGYGR